MLHDMKQEGQDVSSQMQNILDDALQEYQTVRAFGFHQRRRFNDSHQFICKAFERFFWPFGKQSEEQRKEKERSQPGRCDSESEMDH